MLDTETKQLIHNEVETILKEKDYDLKIRLVKIEEELKHQREIIQQVIQNMDKRFEQMDKRFEQVDKRFEQQTKLISIGFVVIGVLIIVFQFLGK